MSPMADGVGVMYGGEVCAALSGKWLCVEAIERDQSRKIGKRVVISVLTDKYADN